MNKYIYGCITIVLFLTGCNGNSTTPEKKKIADKVYYESLFGETYLAQGTFVNDEKDNIETKAWMYTNLDRPLILYGSYENGLPMGTWNFGLNDETVLSSQWDIYKNVVTSCSFSMPFKFQETQIDPFSFKLSTMNDSLGKITTIVQISNQAEKDENLNSFVLQSEKALYSKGYSFTNNKREIKRNGGNFYFTEYFLKDSAKKTSKVYYIYGNNISKKHFVEFTLFHEGPKEDLVKIIYNLMVTSLYIGNERFFNPYKSRKD